MLGFFTNYLNYSASAFFAAAGFLAAADLGAAAFAVVVLAVAATLAAGFALAFVTLMPATDAPVMALMAALKRLLWRAALFL